jgi:hypothetical protein
VEDEDVAAGADATEAAGGEAALTAEALAAGEVVGWDGAADDFDQLEADEDEEEVQVRGVVRCRVCFVPTALAYSL